MWPVVATRTISHRNGCRRNTIVPGHICQSGMPSSRQSPPRLFSNSHVSSASVSVQAPHLWTNVLMCRKRQVLSQEMPFCRTNLNPVAVLHAQAAVKLLENTARSPCFGSGNTMVKSSAVMSANVKGSVSRLLTDIAKRYRSAVTSNRLVATYARLKRNVAAMVPSAWRRRKPMSYSAGSFLRGIEAS